jgi:hypothetical protein
VAARRACIQDGVVYGALAAMTLLAALGLLMLFVL